MKNLPARAHLDKSDAIKLATATVVAVVIGAAVAAIVRRLRRKR